MPKMEFTVPDRETAQRFVKQYEDKIKEVSKDITLTCKGEKIILEVPDDETFEKIVKLWNEM